MSTVVSLICLGPSFQNIFIKVRFLTLKEDGSTGPTAFESDGPYFEIMGQ